MNVPPFGTGTASDTRSDPSLTDFSVSANYMENRKAEGRHGSAMAADPCTGVALEMPSFYLSFLRASLRGVCGSTGTVSPVASHGVEPQASGRTPGILWTDGSAAAIA